MLEVLVGMIASGKSSYAHSRAECGAALVVAHDDLTAMLHTSYRYKQEFRSLYRRMEEAIVREAVGAGQGVIIDRTHLTFESRGRWLALGRLLGVPVDAVVFPIEAPEVHARRRFEYDPRGRSYEDWLGVARHHAAQAAAEPLALDFTEGFAAIRDGVRVRDRTPMEEGLALVVSGTVWS